GRVVEGPDIENDKTRPGPRLLGKRGAAFGAEMAQDRLAAAADSGVRLDDTVELDLLLRDADQPRKGAAGEFLAVAAMADCGARRVGLGGVAHRAAQATAGDRRHRYPPRLSTAPLVRDQRHAARTSCRPRPN